jgi:hypothetical protein
MCSPNYSPNPIGAGDFRTLAPQAVGHLPSVEARWPTPAFTLDEVTPHPADVAGFDVFLQRYRHTLPVQQAAVDHTRKAVIP